MGSRRHPLDIFRSTDKGFNHASRQRRTVVGKVLNSTARPAKGGAASSKSRGPGLLGARKSSAGTKAPPLSPAAARANAVVRQVAWGTGVLVVLVGLVIVLRSTFIDDGASVPSLSTETVLGSRRDAAADTGALSTVLAATYGTSEDAWHRACEAHDELEARGFGDLLVVQLEGGASGAGYQLLVGRASAGALDEVRAALRELDDWPHGDPRPFRQASIQPYPELLDG